MLNWRFFFQSSGFFHTLDVKINTNDNTLIRYFKLNILKLKRIRLGPYPEQLWRPSSPPPPPQPPKLNPSYEICMARITTITTCILPPLIRPCFKFSSLNLQLYAPCRHRITCRYGGGSSSRLQDSRRSQDIISDDDQPLDLSTVRYSSILLAIIIERSITTECA